MALQPFVGPCQLFQFLDPIHGRYDSLDEGSPSQRLYLHTGQQKQIIKAQRYIHASSGIPTHDPSVRESEDSLCFRPRGHCDGSYIFTLSVTLHIARDISPS
jgi:hypothetical protein